MPSFINRAPAATLVTDPDRWLGNSLTLPLVDGSPAAFSSVPEIVAVFSRAIEKSTPVCSCDSAIRTNCASLAFGVPGKYERV